MWLFCRVFVALLPIIVGYFDGVSPGIVAVFAPYSPKRRALG